MKCDRPGYFRGVILPHSIGMQQASSPSKSVGVVYTAELTEWWDEEANDGNGAWFKLEGDYVMEVEGTSWIVGKEGAVNQRAIDALCQHTGWSGNTDDIFDGSWQPTPCQFVVKEETFRNNTTLKVAFINDFNRTPGGGGNVSHEQAAAIKAQYGAQLRAIAGATKKAEPATKKPASPPSRSRPNAKPDGAKSESETRKPPVADGDIPF